MAKAIIRKGLSHPSMDPVQINAAMIRQLDLSPLHVWSHRLPGELLEEGLFWS